LGRFMAPTLLLVGSESPSWAKRSTEAFASAIRDARVHVLEGHGHGASVSGPELLASELRGFLAG
jgi:pimeloyl-ACP methyl ester carboxylesterase